MKSEKMSIAENLIELRKKKGLSQVAIAHLLDIGERTYQNYEYGTSLPSLMTAIALADLYEVSLDALVGRERKK